MVSVDASSELPIAGAQADLLLAMSAHLYEQFPCLARECGEYCTRSIGFNCGDRTPTHEHVSSMREALRSFTVSFHEGIRQLSTVIAAARAEDMQTFMSFGVARHTTGGFHLKGQLETPGTHVSAVYDAAAARPRRHEAAPSKLFARARFDSVTSYAAVTSQDERMAGPEDLQGGVGSRKVARGAVPEAVRGWNRDSRASPSLRSAAIDFWVRDRLQRITIPERETSPELRVPVRRSSRCGQTNSAPLSTGWGPRRLASSGYPYSVAHAKAPRDCSHNG